MPQMQQDPRPSAGRRQSAGGRGRGKESATDSSAEPSAEGEVDEAYPADLGGQDAGSGSADERGGEAAVAEDDGDDPRRVAHEVLGQAHAVLVIALDDANLPHWCPPELIPDQRATRAALWDAVGKAQVLVSSGRHDVGIAGAGLGGPVSRPKRKLLRRALERLSEAVAGGNGVRVRRWLRVAAGAAATVTGSLAEELPGGHLLSEALEGLLSGVETVEATAAEAGATMNI